MDDTIEQRREELYSAVGKALSAWNGVEAILGTLFAYCITNDMGGGNASGAFWAVVSFDAKLKMSDAVVRSRLQGRPECISKWNTINNRLFAQSKNRNKVAHGTVMIFQWPEKDGLHVDVCLAPYFWTFRSMQGPGPLPNNRLYATDLNRYETMFRATGERLSALTQAVSEEISAQRRKPKAELLQ